MKRLLHEPLVHFFVLGAVCFAAYTWLNRGAGDARAVKQVRIGENDAKWLRETWVRQWQREPTREELRGLVTDYLREQLLVREAREMGLDDNDTFIRRWLAQKVQFLVQDTSRLAEPTEADLRRFYVANPDRFTDAARVSFTHVFFSRESRKDAVADAKAALAELLAPANPTARVGGQGDPLLLDREYENTDEQTVAAQFGREFARAVFALKPGAWNGPLESGYGLHLVRVSAMKPARPREFAEVRTQVLDRWREERQREDAEKYFSGLLKKYDVVLDESVKPFVGEPAGRLSAPAGDTAAGGLR